MAKEFVSQGLCYWGLLGFQGTQVQIEARFTLPGSYLGPNLEPGMGS